MKTQIVFHDCTLRERGENAAKWRISFSIVQNEREMDGFFGDFKQDPVETVNLELVHLRSKKRLVRGGRPAGFEGNFNRVAFRREAEVYFRGCFGPDGEFDEAKAKRKKVVALP